MAEPDIHCPRCAWRPRAEDRWLCVPGCDTHFNTFWTGGVCPGCGLAWRVTQCLVCHEFSPHKAWYHWPTDADTGARRPARRKRKEPVSA